MTDSTSALARYAELRARAMAAGARTQGHFVLLDDHEHSTLTLPPGDDIDIVAFAHDDSEGFAEYLDRIERMLAELHGASRASGENAPLVARAGAWVRGFVTSTPVDDAGRAQASSLDAQVSRSPQRRGWYSRHRVAGSEPGDRGAEPTARTRDAAGRDRLDDGPDARRNHDRPGTHAADFAAAGRPALTLTTAAAFLRRMGAYERLERAIDEIADGDPALRQQLETAARTLMRQTDDEDDIIDGLQQMRSRQHLERNLDNVPGATFVDQTPTAYVYKINDWNGAKALGTDRWCIVRARVHWQEYRKRGVTFYFYVDKQKGPPATHAVGMLADGRREIYDKNNDMVSLFEESLEPTERELTDEQRKHVQYVQDVSRLVANPSTPINTLIEGINGRLDVLPNEIIGPMMKHPNFVEAWNSANYKPRDLKSAVRALLRYHPGMGAQLGINELPRSATLTYVRMLANPVSSEFAAETEYVYNVEFPGLARNYEFVVNARVSEGAIRRSYVTARPAIWAAISKEPNSPDYSRKTDLSTQEMVQIKEVVGAAFDAQTGPELVRLTREAIEARGDAMLGNPRAVLAVPRELTQGTRLVDDRGQHRIVRSLDAEGVCVEEDCMPWATFLDRLQSDALNPADGTPNELFAIQPFDGELSFAIIRNGTMVTTRPTEEAAVEEMRLRVRLAIDEAMARAQSRTDPPAQRTAEAVTIDETLLASFRKDTLTLLASAGRAANYAEALQVAEGVRHFRDYLNEVLFKRWMNTYEGAQPNKVRSATWDLYIALNSIPLRQSEGEAGLPRFFAERDAWVAKTKRAAQAAWRELKKVTEFKPGKATLPSRDQINVEGFQVQMSGYEPERDVDKLGLLRASLREYRRDVEARAPSILRSTLPLVAVFEAMMDIGGRYENDHIILVVSNLDSPRRGAWILAHEMGHHVYKTILSSEARAAWTGATGNTQLDIASLIARWPEDATSSEFEEQLKREDPRLYWQLNSLEFGHGGRSELYSRRQFVDLLAKGITYVNVPETPISGYAEKNDEEAFCEAFGIYVAYGPQALYPEIRARLDRILPELRTVTAEVVRTARDILGAGVPNVVDGSKALTDDIVSHIERIREARGIEPTDRMEPWIDDAMRTKLQAAMSDVVGTYPGPLLDAYLELKTPAAQRRIRYLRAHLLWDSGGSPAGYFQQGYGIGLMIKPEMLLWPRHRLVAKLGSTIMHELRHAADYAYHGGEDFNEKRHPGLHEMEEKQTEAWWRAYLANPTELASWAGNVANSFDGWVSDNRIAEGVRAYTVNMWELDPNGRKIVREMPLLDLIEPDAKKRFLQMVVAAVRQNNPRTERDFDQWDLRKDDLLNARKVPDELVRKLVEYTYAKTPWLRNEHPSAEAWVAERGADDAAMIMENDYEVYQYLAKLPKNRIDEAPALEQLIERAMGARRSRPPSFDAPAPAVTTEQRTAAIDDATWARIVREGQELAAEAKALGAHEGPPGVFTVDDQTVSDPSTWGEGARDMDPQVIETMLDAWTDAVASFTGQNLMREQEDLAATWGRTPEGYSAEESAARDAWYAKMTRAVADGQISPTEASRLGWMPESNLGEAKDWKPIPERVYHVTTALSKVLESGRLKTRDELGYHQGQGLGGSPKNVISVSKTLEGGQSVLHALREGRDVLAGRLTPEMMWAKAEAGEGAQRPYADFMRQYRDHGTGIGVTSLFGHFSRARAEAGGPPYVAFFDVDAKALAAVPDEEIALLELAPKPGAVAADEGDPGEMRIPFGDQLEIVRVVPENERTAAVGQIIEVPANSPIFRNPEPFRFVVREERNGKVKITPDYSEYGTWVPAESLASFESDLNGRVPDGMTPDSGHPAVDAVIRGEGQLLGKGDDGVAWRVGDQVVKMSTTVPFQPMNPGHRTPAEAAQMMRGQSETAAKLQELGAPGMLVPETVEHQGKVFQVRPYVEIPEQFTPDELDQVQDMLDAVHQTGYAMRDELQVGRTPDGALVFFDIGKAAPIESHDSHFGERGSDADNLRHLYRRHKAPYVPRGSFFEDAWKQLVAAAEYEMIDASDAPRFQGVLEQARKLGKPEVEMVAQALGRDPKITATVRTAAEVLAAFDVQAVGTSEKEAWQLPFREYIEAVGGEKYHSRDAYEGYNAEPFFDRPSTLIDTMTLSDGRAVEFRRSNIGRAMTDGTTQKEKSIFAVLDGWIIGEVQDEWGATLIRVDPDFRGEGIGTQLGFHSRREWPERGSGGMTPQGYAMNKRLHEKIVADALARGEDVPPEVLAEYPDIQPARMPDRILDEATPETWEGPAYGHMSSMKPLEELESYERSQIERGDWPRVDPERHLEYGHPNADLWEAMGKPLQLGKTEHPNHRPSYWHSWPKGKPTYQETLDFFRSREIRPDSYHQYAWHAPQLASDFPKRPAPIKKAESVAADTVRTARDVLGASPGQTRTGVDLRFPPKEKALAIILESVGDAAHSNFHDADAAYRRWRSQYAGYRRGPKPVYRGGELDAVNLALNLSKDQRVSGLLEAFERLTVGVRSWTDPRLQQAVHVLSEIPGLEKIRLPDFVLEHGLDAWRFLGGPREGEQVIATPSALVRTAGLDDLEVLEAFGEAREVLAALPEPPPAALVAAWGSLENLAYGLARHVVAETTPPPEAQPIVRLAADVVAQAKTGPDIRRVIDPSTGDHDMGRAGLVRDGEVVGWHVTDDPAALAEAVRAGRIIDEDRAHQELGPGLYLSAIPEFWVNRSTNKWSFLEKLDGAQRGKLAQAILAELQRRSGHFTDSEMERARTRLVDWVADPAAYVIELANMPYGIPFWRPDFLTQAGLDADTLTTSPVSVEVRARGRFVELTRRLTGDEWRQLAAEYDGAFTRASMGTNAELVIWNPAAITHVGEPERIARVAMPMPTELPSGWRMSTVGGATKRAFRIYSPESPGAAVATLNIAKDEDDDTWSVTWAHSSVSGFGAYLYDQALRWASARGEYLESDGEVSDSAMGVWDKFHEREDVEREPRKTPSPKHLQQEKGLHENPAGHFRYRLKGTLVRTAAEVLAENEKTAAPRRRKPPAQATPQEPICVLHNLSQGNLIHAGEVGGLMAPSLAVTKASLAFENFGDVSLVAPLSMVDPSTTPVFDADIYSPRYPSVRYKVNDKALRRFETDYEPEIKTTETYLSDANNTIKNEGAEGLLSRRTLAMLQYAFLTRVKGVQMAPPTRQKPVEMEWADSPSMRTFYNQNKDSHFSNWRPEHPEWAAMSDAAVRGIREYWEARDIDPEMKQEMIQMSLEHHFDNTGDAPRLWFGHGDKLNRSVKNLDQTEPDQYAFRDMLTEAVKPYQAEFDTWARAQVMGLQGDRYLTTEGGRNMQYTPENVLKMMTKKTKGGENFNYWIGSIRALGAKRFRSVEQMQAESDRLVSHEQMEAVKKDLNDKFFALSEQLQSYHPAGREMGFMSTVGEAMGESFKRGRSLHNEMRQSGFEPVPSDLLQKVQEFKKELVNAPTEYFEAKPQRIVKLSEFVAAVLPSTSSQQVFDILAAHGLTTFPYDKDVPGARAQALAQATATARQAGRLVLRTAREILAMPMPRDLPPGWRLDVDEDLRPGNLQHTVVTFQVLSETDEVVATATIESYGARGPWVATYAENYRPEGGWGAYLVQKAMEYSGERGLIASDNVSDAAASVFSKMLTRDDVLSEDAAGFFSRRRIKRNEPDGGEHDRAKNPALWMTHKVKKSSVTAQQVNVGPTSAPMSPGAPGSGDPAFPNTTTTDTTEVNGPESAMVQSMKLRNSQLYERALAAGGREVQPGTMSMGTFGWVWHPSAFGEIESAQKYREVLDEIEKRVVAFEQRKRGQRRTASWAEYLSKRKFDSPEEVAETVRRLVDRANAQGAFAPEDAEAVLRSMRIVQVGDKFMVQDPAKVEVKTAPPVSRRLAPEDRAPAVDWYARDLFDGAGDGPITDKDLHATYGDGRAKIYKGYIPTHALSPQLAEQNDDEDGEDSGYDWSELETRRTAPPPPKVKIRRDGQLEIIDGNHRIHWWTERGYSAIPAWIVDERPRKKKARVAMPMQQPREGLLMEWSGAGQRMGFYLSEDGQSLGVLTIGETEDPNVMAVRRADVNESGYGPMLYDAALEWVARDGKWLTSDRRNVTVDAARVWQKYQQRGDVESAPVPAALRHSPLRLLDAEQNAALDFMYRKSDDSTLRFFEDTYQREFGQAPPHQQPSAPDSDLDLTDDEDADAAQKRGQVEEELPPYLYHVTFAHNLMGIAEHGLTPNQGGGSTFGGYGGNVAGRLFLTTADGASYWFGKIRDQAEHHYEGESLGEAAPVVVRVATASLDADALVPDEVANRESSLADAWIYADAIEPEELTAWSGRAWVPVDAVDPAQLYTMQHENDGDEDDEGWDSYDFQEPSDDAYADGRLPEPPQAPPQRPQVTVRAEPDGSFGVYRTSGITGREQMPFQVMTFASEVAAREAAERLAKSIGGVRSAYAERMAALRPGKEPGASGCVVVPIPRSLAKMWPQSEEGGYNGGDPHLTIAYIPGPLSDEDKAAIVRVLEEVAENMAPVPIEFERGVSWLSSDSGDGEVAYKAVFEKSEERLAELHWAIVDALREAGIEPKTRDTFVAHATLEYCDTRDYDGPVPEGGFRASRLELWGWEDTPAVELRASVRRTTEDILGWSVAAETRTAARAAGRGSGRKRRKRKEKRRRIFRPTWYRESGASVAFSAAHGTAGLEPVTLRADAKVLDLTEAMLTQAVADGAREAMSRTAATSESEVAGLIEAVRQQASAIEKLSVMVDRLLAQNTGGYDAIRTEGRLIILNPDALEKTPPKSNWNSAGAGPKARARSNA